MTKLGPITIRINEIVTRTVIVNTVAGSSPLNTSLVAGKMYGGRIDGYMGGGKVRKAYMADGGAVGSDTVPAMLTPGEFIMSKYAVQAHGIDNMKKINNGDSVSDSVYNYSISVNVKSDANPDEIARVVMTQIKSVESQKIRGNRI